MKFDEPWVTLRQPKRMTSTFDQIETQAFLKGADPHSPISKSILRKSVICKDEDEKLNCHSINDESATVSFIVLPGFFVFAAILSCTISIIASVNSVKHPSAGYTLQLEYNYCQVALGAVLFFEILICLGGEDPCLSKTLFFPLSMKVVGVIIYSCLANGQLPLLYARNGRALNPTLGLLWATSSPCVIFLFGKLARHKPATLAHLMPASALGSALVASSLLASCAPGHRSAACLSALSLALWAAFLFYVYTSAPGSSPEAQAQDLQLVTQLVAEPGQANPIFLAVFNSLGIVRGMGPPPPQE